MTWLIRCPIFIFILQSVIFFIESTYNFDFDNEMKTEFWMKKSKGMKEQK